MTPIYFPFTDMSDPTVAAMSAVFKRVILYRPSAAVPDPLQQQADAGFLEIRIPIQGDEAQLTRMVADYQTWAERHSGSLLAFFTSQGGQIPFFDEASLSQIRSDIRRWAEETTNDEATDPGVAARLFLAVAQTFDRQQWEVNRSFSGLRDLESSLLKSIHGEEAGAEPPMSAPVEDLGHHMTGQRLWAWSCLWANDPAAGSLLVTDSREIFETVLDPIFDSPSLERFDMNWPIENVSGEMQEELLRFLEGIRTGEADPSAAPALPAGEGERMVLHLGRVHEMGPLDLITRASGEPGNLDPDRKNGTFPDNTIIVHMEFPVR